MTTPINVGDAPDEGRSLVTRSKVSCGIHEISNGLNSRELQILTVMRY